MADGSKKSFESFADASTAYAASEYFAGSTHDLVDDSKRSQTSEQWSIDAPFLLKRPPLAELGFTPPPTPPRQQSPTSFRFPPLLQRASTVISKHTSMSPVRPQMAETAPAPPSRTSTPTKRNRPGKGLAGFADLFSGSSAPVNIGLVPSPKRELYSPDGGFPNLSGRPPNHRRGSSLQAAASSFFGLQSRPSLQSQRRIAEDNDEDPMLYLNLEKELFPSGIPGQDAPSANAYDELISNASRLFLRMQDAYAAKHKVLSEVSASKRFDEEELEEARTRAKHLKLQLDGMSAKVADQEDTVHCLERELAVERHRRRLGHDARQGMIRLVDENHPMYESRPSSRDSESEESYLSSDEESESESVFSNRPKTAYTSAPSVVRVDGAQMEELAPWVSPAASFLGLSQENQRLKARVAELEETVNGCLGLVGEL